MKIRYLRDICFDDLFENIKNNYEKYKSDKIWIDEYFPDESFFIESNIEINEAKLFVDSKKDYNNAILLYEAIKNLTPYQATNSYLWTYLAHENYYQYMNSRWSITNEEINSSDITKIRERYFCQPTRRGLLRNGISRLWWVTYLSYKHEGPNHYEYTKILFSDEDLLLGLMERDYAMCKNVVIGIMKYMSEFLINNDRLPDRDTRRKLFKYINMIGATTLLELMSADEIYDITKKFCLQIETKELKLYG